MNLLHFFVLITAHACLIEGYRTFSMRDLNSCSKPVEIHLSSMRRNSTGILVYASESTFEPGLHCEIVLRPPLGYGIVVSIRSINLQPSVINYADCENYLEISKIGRRDSGKARLCGYSDDEYEFQSYIHWGRTNIIFRTSNSSKINGAAFQLTFTAIRKGNNWCFGEEQRCHNGHCIWKGLSCDGHNNCGDVSDELNKFIAHCDKMSTGESLAVILVTIVGSLILLIIAAYLRGPKITQQIERLSAARSTNAQGVPSESGNNANINRVVSTISTRSNYGATAGLLSPESYQAVMDDPPPSYEEVLGLPISSAQNPEFHPISRNVSSNERHSTSRSSTTTSVSRNSATIDRESPSINRNIIDIDRSTTSIYRNQS